MSSYPSTSASTDAALVSLTRRGDRHAYRTLVARHLEAVRLAVHLLGGSPGLVRTTFDVAHGCLLRESGSSDAVRPFVLQLARQLHDAPEPEDGLLRGDSFWGIPFREDDDLSRHPTVATEVSWLPHSWQTVLWHRLVEREDDAAVATTIGVPPAKIPLLAEGALALIRRNLVARHRKGSPPQCLGYGLRLERATVGVPRAVMRHAHGCPRCARLLEDLRAVDTALPQILAESLLGEAGRSYLAVRAADRVAAGLDGLDQPG